MRDADNIPVLPVSPTADAWYRKRRYHHGDLHNSALLRGAEMVARAGPAALTLRALARELGVSATALVHYFGHVKGLRAASDFD